MTVKELSSEVKTPASAVGRAGNTQRPKSVAQWSVVDVQKWLRRHCGDFYHLYCEAFLEQEVTGRCLVRMTENSLMRLGIIHPEHRQFIWREIAKLRLRSSILYLRDQERRLASSVQAGQHTEEY
jgi:hypothetical protein